MKRSLKGTKKERGRSGSVSSQELLRRVGFLEMREDLSGKTQHELVEESALIVNAIEDAEREIGRRYDELRRRCMDGMFERGN